MLQKILSLLLPAWLKRLDHYLLTRRPLLWLSKIHYVAFYSLLAYVLLGAVLWAYPVSPRELPEIGPPSKMTLWFSLAGAGLWLFFQLRDTNNKKFGQTGRYTDVWRLLLSMVCIIVMMMPFILVRVVLNTRVASLRSPDELVADINTLNRGYAYFVLHAQHQKPGDPNYIQHDHKGEDDRDCRRYHDPFDALRFYGTFGEVMAGKIISEEQLRDAFLAEHSPAAILQHIRAYQQTAQKYADFPLSDANEVLRRFKRSISAEEENSFKETSWEVQQQIALSMRTIAGFHYKDWLLTKNEKEGWTAFAAFFILPLVLLIYQQLGRRSLAWTMGGLLLFVFVAYLVEVGWLFFSIKVAGMDVSRNIRFIALCPYWLFFIISWLMAQRIKTARYYARFREVCLVISSLLSPFVLIAIHVQTTSFYHKKILWSMLPLTMLLSIPLYLLFVAPRLSLLYKINKSLPEK